MNSLPLFDNIATKDKAQRNLTNLTPGVLSRKPSLPTAKTPSQARKVNYVTELLVSKFCDDYLSLLLPMLGHQTRIANQRWVSWISHTKIDKSLLNEFGVEASQVRFIYPKQHQGLFELTVKALVAGTSHCVVVVVDSFSQEQLMKIKEAANTGDTMALLVSHRQEEPQ